MESERKQEGRHDFSGSCTPGFGAWGGQETFSVGIFQWIPKNSKNGLKKSAVKFRIKGKVIEKEKVYQEAINYCDMMDNGYIPKTKSMSV